MCSRVWFVQLVYIPVPDRNSRRKIFESCLRKSPLAPDVSFDKMADATEGFSGADLNEICQRACKLAIREEIAQWTEWAQTQEDVKNPSSEFVSTISVIGKHHFEESFRFARRSVTDKDVRKYETFRQKMLAAAAGAQDKVGGDSDPAENKGADLTELMGGKKVENADEEDLYG